MSLISRRRFLAGTACLVAGAGLARSGSGASAGPSLAAAAEPGAGRTVTLDLVAAERPEALPCFDGIPLPLWTYAGDWLPVVRIGLGDRLDVRLDNRLPRAGEHTSVHWHGIRLPNDQDGVPHLVQPAVMPGESFRYGFVPPDTGTFFFHSHCNGAEQLGRGLAGILIVEGDTTAPYAADETLLLRDWVVDRAKRDFGAFVTRRGASRAGTYGNIRSANGTGEADLRLPAGADSRLRLVNSDPTRVMEIAVDGAEAAVLAVDGIAVSPFPLDGWLLGPGMRLDLAVRAPGEGGEATLVDRNFNQPLVLSRLIGSGPAAPARPFDPVPLRAGRIPEAKIADAERLDFVFAPATAGYGALVPASGPPGLPGLGSLCLSSSDFWTINETAWPGGEDSRLPPPLARLGLGRPYVFTLRNDSKLAHPIHIHGHTFKVLRSDRRPLPVHHADTVLLMPDETVEVAFVADNPGRWMFHCHVIEHQETGMMGYVEVA